MMTACQMFSCYSPQLPQASSEVILMQYLRAGIERCIATVLQNHVSLGEYHKDL